MTTRPNANRESLIRRQIGAALTRARLALFWERLWPRLLLPLVVVGLFALLSLTGFWSGLLEWLRLTALAILALAGLASLFPLTSLRWPSRTEAFVRIEHATGTPHRPATGFFDTLAGSSSDPATSAAWEAHRARLLANFSALRSGLPSPGVARRDQFGLRFLLLLVLTVAFIAAGARFDRLGDAFRGGGSVALAETAAVRIDAWAQPPDYTRRPAILLTGDLVAAPEEGWVVPEGTEVVVRVAGDNADAITVAAAGAEIVEQSRIGEGPREIRIVLAGDAEIHVAANGEQLEAWSFSVVTDLAPTIAITSGPERASGGGLQLAYIFADDYGVTEAWGEITLIAPIPGARPLVDAPALALTIPRSDPRQGEAVTVRDLSEHPWAGLEVDVTLVAADAIGQIGLSGTRSVILPGRVFVNPIARELITQRQALALDARQNDNALLAIARLAESPEAAEDLGTYLALRSAYFRLRNADYDNERRAFLDYLWEIAIALEANPLANAAAELQAAADALRDAIERGATDAEIAKLTDYLRNAMQQYMQALAATGAQQREAQPAVAVDTQIMRPEELEEMLNDIQDLATIGNVTAAEQLLNQLERMMQNLEAGNIDEMQREFQAGQEALDDLGFLMQQQQRLLDETFGLQQEQNQPIPNPRTEAEAERLLDELFQRRAEQEARADDLARQQRQLQAQMGQLMEQMAGGGMYELPGAERNMAEAGERLDEGRPGMAVNNQAEALEQMRATAEAIAEQLAENAAAAAQIGPEGQQPQDPFGRTPPIEGDRYGDNVQVPTEIDRQTAREILEIIRQRLEDRGRPAEEIQYLERLIELY